MKRHFWKKLIVWQLVLCILTPALPLEWAQGILSAASAHAEMKQAARSTEGAFMELVESAAGEAAMTEGEWRYAVIQPQNYAVVLGHADASARELTVPDVLGGADVVGLAAGALRGHAALESLSLPGNVNAIADGAIPRGTLVKGYHGTYAHNYALNNRYAFQSRSAYDFASGVIDYADVRREAFVRHSAHSLSLRALEAARLSEGSVFFLIDPDNAYQISYYRVTSLAQRADGFVDVQCETPVMDEIMRSFSGRNEEMRLDYSTLMLADGVAPLIDRSSEGNKDVTLPLNITLPLGLVDVKVTGQYSTTFEALEYEGKKDSKKSASIKQTVKSRFALTVTQHNALSLQDAFKGNMSSLTQIAERAQSLSNKFDVNASVPYKHPLGVGYVFSYAGLVTLQVELGMDFELKGSGTIQYVSDIVTIYEGDTDGNTTKTSEVLNDHITANAQLKARVGIKAEGNLYILCVCVFQLSGFVGLEARLEWEFLDLDLGDGDLWDNDKAVNLLDCMTLKVYLVVEIGMRAGVLKVFNVDFNEDDYVFPVKLEAGAFIRPVYLKLVDKHLHLQDEVARINLTTGELTYAGDKDREHDSKECPYGKSTLEVRLSIPVEKQKALLMTFDHLDAGFTIDEPEDPTEDYDNYKLTGWYSSEKVSDSNRVAFPHTIKEGKNLIYGRVVKKQKVHFILEDGTEIGDPVELFPGDSFTLPDTEGRNIVKWKRVQSPYNLSEHPDQPARKNGAYITPAIHSDMYMCGFEAPEIEVTFYESVDGGKMYETGRVTVKAGQAVQAPESSISSYYKDAGWQVVGGERIAMPYTIPALQTEPIRLVHFLGMRPTDDSWSTEDGSQSSHFTYKVTGKSGDPFREVIITGRKQYWEDEDGSPVYSPSVNLVIPAYIEGWPVTTIADDAFAEISTLKTVTLPHTLQYVESDAFYKCANLARVNAGAVSGDLHIGFWAFYECRSLVDFTVSSEAYVHYGTGSFEYTAILEAPRIAALSGSAFAGCRQLKRAEMLDSCTSVGSHAFSGCCNLQEVVMSPNLVTIGWNAFKNTSISEVKLPGLLKYIDDEAFADNPCLTTVELSCTDMGTNVFSNCPALESAAVFGLSVIPEYTFSGCVSLQEISIPASTEIGEYAFENCYSLQQIALSEGLADIKDYAFSNCRSLQEICAPATLVSIGSRAFENCESLVSLQLAEGLKQIEGGAFYGCSSLKELILPSTVSDLGYHFISGCTDLKKLVVNSKANLAYRLLIGEGCSLEVLEFGEGIVDIPGTIFDPTYNNSAIHNYHASLHTVVFPSTLETIGKSAFKNFNLREAVIRGSLKSIGTEAFANCPLLETVIVEGDQAVIDERAFAGLPSLRTVSLNGVKQLGRYAFDGSAVERAFIGDGMEKIDSYAFRDCVQLESINIPDTVTSMGDSVLKGCPSLKELRIGACLPANLFGNDNLREEHFASLRVLEIGDSITKIPAQMFQNMVSELEVLVLPGNLAEIGFNAFEGLGANFREITFPETLENIGSNAFKNSHLEKVELPASVREVRDSAFEGLKTLETVVIHGTDVTIGSYAFRNCASLKNFIIRGSVKSISTQALYGCALETVELSEKVDFIGTYAFAANPNLRSFILHGSGCTLGGGIVRYCGNLEYLYIDGVETIKQGDFYQGSETPLLRRIVLGEGVKHIDTAAFQDTPHLESVSLPPALETIGTLAFSGTAIRELDLTGKNLKTIGEKAFQYCRDLQRVTLDGTELQVGDFAFSYCSALESVHVGSGVKHMGGSCFYKSGLREITFEEGLETIGRYAFSEAVNLRSLSIPDSVTSCANNAFNGCTGMESLHIGAGIDLSNSTLRLILPSNLRHLSIAEGHTELASDAIHFFGNKLETVVFPESLTVIRRDNLEYLRYSLWVKLSSALATVEYNGSDYTYSNDARLTLITDTYNEAAAQFARKLNVGCLSLDSAADEYTVTYFLSINGQAQEVPVSSVKTGLLSRLDLPQPPAQEGLCFDGWYYDAHCTQPVLDNDIVTSDMALYAGFRPHGSTVLALRLPALTQLPGTQESALVPEGYVLYAQLDENDRTLPQDPVLDGYVFSGWYRDSRQYHPFDAKSGAARPDMLYGSFVLAGHGALTKPNPTGLTLAHYALAESDSSVLVLPEAIDGTPVTAIGPGAFSGLNVTDMVVPAHVAHIDPDAFAGADKLAHLTVDRRNPHFISQNGVLFSADGSVLVHYPQGRRTFDYTVPQGVKTIADRAFEGSVFLRAVTLPDGLEAIGDRAFARTALIRAVLPDSVHTLGAGAFDACSNLRVFTAYGLETIGSNALPGSSWLAVRGPVMQGALRSHVTGDQTVNLSYNIRYFTVMDGQNELAAYAVEAGAALPAQIVGDMVGEDRVVYALYADEALTAPYDTSSMMPDENVTVYADVRNLWESEAAALETGESGVRLTAYNGDGGELTIPHAISGSSVIALGGQLLASARGAATSVTIPSSVLHIADTALCGADGTAYAGKVFADEGSYAAQWAAQMGYACQGSIHTLRFNTLGGASIAPMQATALAAVRLPRPVKSGASFAGWYLDKTCTTAAALDEAGLYLMPGWSVTLYAGWTHEADVPFTWVEENNGITITGYTGASSEVAIPETINGLPVTGIGSCAFLGRDAITSLSLPETLLTIGDNAFARMSALEGIIIPDSVRSIGDAAVRGCTALAQAHIGTGLETLGDQAFYGAESLAAFTAGEGGAFTAADGVLCCGASLICAPAGMTGTLVIPETIQTIAPYALAHSGVESIIFPQSLMEIGEGALYDCDRLTEIVLDSGSKLSIPDRFASDADQLHTVRLGARVLAVGAGAFMNCPALLQAELAPEATLIGQNAFALAHADFAITGARGSAAHAYAVKNGLHFRSTDGNDIESLQFDAESAEYALGQQIRLNVTALPAMPADEQLRWSSSDESVAAVADGVVRCLARGTVTITATAQNGVSASLILRVRGSAAESVALPAETLYVPLGGQAAFEPILTPAWADTACSWSIGDETIAAVDENGKITGLTLGATTLHVITPSGMEADAALVVFIPVEEVTLPQEEQALTLNAIDNPTVQLHPQIVPHNATFSQLTYVSGDSSVASVSESGLISAVGAGETTVTLTNAYTTGDPITLSIPVKVKPYDISGVPAPEIPDKVYNGYSAPADFTLVIGGRTLKNGTDYTVESDGSASVGEHTAVINGIGLFKGSITAAYSIIKKPVEITYNGPTVMTEFDWYSIIQEITTNVSRYSVQLAFALASDPANWLAETPTAPGEYIMRFYVNETSSMQGCEVLVPVRLVTSLVRDVRFVTDEIHLLEGQSVCLLLDVVKEEGADIGWPSFLFSIDGTDGLVSVSGTCYIDNRLYPIISLGSGEGSATITATCTSHDAPEAKVTIHVHKDAQVFNLPKIVEVADEAFLNTQANVIRFGGQKLAVGSRSFADSQNLWQVCVPSGKVALSADMLQNAGAAVVMFASIYADGIQQAIDLGIPFASKY